MPYIPKVDRSRVASSGATNAGELNFELTLAIRAYLRSVAPLKYQHINDTVAALDWARSAISCQVFSSDGPLRNALHNTCNRYIERTCKPHMTTDKYWLYQGQAERDVLGALECCKLEFYRRVAVPYEDRKITLNGDCY